MPGLLPGRATFAQANSATRAELSGVLRPAPQVPLRAWRGLAPREQMHREPGEAAAGPPWEHALWEGS